MRHSKRADVVHHPFIQLLGLGDCCLPKGAISSWISDADDDGEHILVSAKWLADNEVAIITEIISSDTGNLEWCSESVGEPADLMNVLTRYWHTGYNWSEPFNTANMVERHHALEQIFGIQVRRVRKAPPIPKQHIKPIVFSINKTAGESEYLNLVQDKPATDDGRYYKFLSKRRQDGQIEGVVVLCWPDREVLVFRKVESEAAWSKRLTMLNEKSLANLGARWAPLD